MAGLRRRRTPLRPLDRFGFRGQQNNGLGCLLGIYRLNLSCGKVTGGPGVASLDVYIIYRRFQQRLPQAMRAYLHVESLRRVFLGEPLSSDALLLRSMAAAFCARGGYRERR